MFLACGTCQAKSRGWNVRRVFSGLYEYNSRVYPWHVVISCWRSLRAKLSTDANIQRLRYTVGGQLATETLRAMIKFRGSGLGIVTEACLVMRPRLKFSEILRRDILQVSFMRIHDKLELRVKHCTKCTESLTSKLMDGECSSLAKHGDKRDKPTL